MKKLYLLFTIFFLFNISAFAQSELEFKGMLTGFTNYGAEGEYPMWSGARYIPELGYDFTFDSLQSFSIEASANIYGSVQYPHENGAEWDGYVKPYRLWARYKYKNTELRVGLQKIDFGSSTLLRPIQWFNEIDPRDPLGLTNGINAALARYYFSNNANLWLWTLYGNEGRRGYDLLESDKKSPEFGGRFQYPVPKGELAFTYHHRNATLDSFDEELNPLFIETIENKWGLDGKWDVGVGLWFEATYTKQNQNIGMLTNQSLVNLGTDYTFGLGNGLNVVLEHLSGFYGEEFNKTDYKTNTTATSLAYPIGFFDNISTMMYYDWGTEKAGFFISYDHQFNLFTTYLMLYYNPTAEETPFQTNDLSQMSPGFGARVMLVYNH
ncbi:hypothetical protein [Sediminitomix flava]|uniref:OmpL-like beta-barrel porin-2 n=1 Tax=Sediminitomix flava TaxID=379075 RepID=A0A315ZGJ3_SEDFL|nr:hypothetical protein [Sediminitomix flava]PWJ44631.1 hypothetical protein BC781_1011002 [Sediminitomix flava]